MNPKIFVAIALMLSLLVSGLILILGFSNNIFLPIYLLLFLLAFFALGLIMIRDLLDNKIFAVSILLVMLAISTSFFLTNLKTYQMVLNDYGNPDNTAEISLMQAENEYGLAYVDYLGQRVTTYKDQSALMSIKLADLEKLRLEKAQQESIVIPVEESIVEPEYIYYYYENDEEEDDDDD